MLAFNLSDIITVPFGYLMSWLYDLTSNYGVALILFAVIVKLVLFPISAKSKKSTMKMSRLTPRVQELQAKYANDPQKQNEAHQVILLIVIGPGGPGALHGHHDLALFLDLAQKVPGVLGLFFAAGGQAQGQYQAKSQCDPFFHKNSSLFAYFFRNSSLGQP